MCVFSIFYSCSPTRKGWLFIFLCKYNSKPRPQAELQPHIHVSSVCDAAEREPASRSEPALSRIREATVNTSIHVLISIPSDYCHTKQKIKGAVGRQTICCGLANTMNILSCVGVRKCLYFAFLNGKYS